MNRLLAVAAVLAAALCFATTGTSRALADVDADAVSIGAARVLIGGGLLALVAVAGAVRTRRGDAAGAGGLEGAGSALPVREPLAPRVPAPVVVLVGAAGVLSYQPTFFTGAAENGVAVGTVVALGSAPIATGLLVSALRRRLPDARWIVATGIAIAGVAIVSGVFGGGEVAVRPAGILASLAAGASYALYAVAAKELLERGWTAGGAMGGIFGVAAALSLPVLLLTDTSWLGAPAGASLALWLGVVTVAVAYLLFGWGLRRLSPTTVSTLTLAEPLGATLLGLAVLGEELSPASAVGVGVIALGLVLVALPSGRGGARVAAAS